MEEKATIARQILDLRDQMGPEEFVSRTFALTSDSRLSSDKLGLSERVSLSFGLLIAIIESSRSGRHLTETFKTEGAPKTEQEKGEIREEVQPQEEPAQPVTTTPIFIPNHYETLGVSKDVSKDGVRDAYRNLMKKYHPDLFHNAQLTPEQKDDVTRWAQDINDAYLVLRSEENRTNYDALISGPNIETYTPSPPGFLMEGAQAVGERVVGEAQKKAVEVGTKAFLKGAGKEAAKKGVEAGAKVAAKEAAKVAVKAGAEAAGTAAAPGLGTLIAFIVTEVLPRIKKIFDNVLSAVLRFFKIEDAKELRRTIFLGTFFGGLYLLGTGNIVGGGVLVGFGGLGGLGELNLATKGAAAKVGGITQSIVAGATSVVFPAIGIPFIIAIVAAPFLVAIFLFIINSGAYLVPPSEFAIAGDNPYIGVEKAVESGGPFENSDLPITVTYTITITARRGSLTNVVFGHECKIIREGSTPACPAPLPATTPAIISPVEPYVFTYTQTYSGSNYRDSLVLNSFTVTADTDEVTGTSATGAASVIIGNPPTGCYTPAGNWPEPYSSNLLGAIGQIVGNYANFMVRLCGGYGQVFLHYDPARVAGCGDWGCTPPQQGNHIYFNSGGLGNQRNATYILAHESGHVLANGVPSLFQSYLAVPGILAELPVCRYGGLSPDEGFAEAVGLYIAQNSCLQNNPLHYNFAQTQIFR